VSRYDLVDNIDETGCCDRFCWQPPILFYSYHNQSPHKEIIYFCSCHHLPFVNVYVSEFRGNDWVELILLIFSFSFFFFLV
jgi:hypothetical protein